MRNDAARNRGSGSRRNAADQVNEALELFPVQRCQTDTTEVRHPAVKDDYIVSSTRSSIKQVYDVISSFTEQKRDLVRSIGFGGILLFPPLKNINRRFAVWLMSRVDPLSQTIVVNNCKRIKFNKTDVEKVFGIPCHGKVVSDCNMPRKVIIPTVKKSYPGTDARENRSIKAAQEVVEKQCSGTMTDTEQDAFKVAFVIYLMSTLLAPGSKYDYVSLEYWGALVEPASIKDFDWCEYVLRKLLQAVVKLKNELQVGNKVSNITGCSVFLQILYLDSIDIGVMNMEHSSFPRIKHFAAEELKSMILADSLSRKPDNLGFEYGRSQLREAAGICYSWACQSFSACAGKIGTTLPGLWEVACSFSRALGVHMKAAGALFFAVAEFEVLSTRNQCNHPSSIASVLSTIIEPFTRGFCYTTCRELAIGWIECDISKMLDEASLFVCSKWQHRICEYEIQPARSTISAESANLESCKCKKRPRDYAASRKH